jgi:hypothetical protein
VVSRIVGCSVSARAASKRKKMEKSEMIAMFLSDFIDD